MANRRKWEEIVADIREDSPELADELDQGYGTTTLREQAGKVPVLEQRVAELETENTGLKRAPERDKAFRDYGVDLENLRPAERRALEAYDGELEAEKLAAFVEELDLPLVSGNGETPPAETPPAAAGVVAAVRAAPAGRQGAGAQITPEMAGTWEPEKWLRFKAEHAEAAETILQGKTVTGITFA